MWILFFCSTLMKRKHQITAVNWRFLIFVYDGVRWLLWLRPTLLCYTEKASLPAVWNRTTCHSRALTSRTNEKWEIKGKRFHAMDKIVGLEFQLEILMIFVGYLITWLDSYQLFKQASDKNPGNAKSRTTTEYVDQWGWALREVAVTGPSVWSFS